MRDDPMKNMKKKMIKNLFQLDCSSAAAMVRGNFGRCSSLVALALLLAVGGGGVHAQQAKPPAKQPAKTAKPARKAEPPLLEAVIEPKAIELLKAASSRLAAARAMKFTATISYEAPSRYGPALVYTTRSDVTMQRPGKLKIVTPGDGPASEFYFDGKQMMAFAPKENLVAIADAPPTIDDTLQFAFHSAEIYFPFSDLIVTDPYVGLSNGMQLAFYIGQSNTVGGTTTDMVAFANDDVFVQIWIGAEDKLPRKMRAVYRRDSLQLRHEMDLSNWQLDPKVTPEEFASEQAKGAKHIKFAHPSTMLPPGTKPVFLRKPSASQPSKTAPAKTK
jgi:hypothetical protein